VRDRLTFAYRAVDPERDRALVLTGGGAGSGDDDAWSDFGIASVAAGVRCDDGAAGTRLALAGGGGTADAIAVGSPVRTYEHLVYRLYADESGIWWLGVRGMTGGHWAAISPVAGPFEHGSGLAFSYRDSLGAATADPVRVAEVAFALRAVSSAAIPSAGGASARYADSLNAGVTPRNGRRGGPP
jgi:hypothetical protein